MSLASGVMAGPYRIEGLIGSGGMGEVYRAQDTRLKRDVALKLLPEGFAGDGQRMRRFEQEARAVAAINHPNILAIHDIGAIEGRPYLISELLEGQSLRQRLQAGTIAARKVAEYGAAIAQGLAAAHGRGIVHRDIKPENIFITKDDRVKILDFGLAKPEAGVGALADADAPTMAASTVPGAVLGTVGYMAPEQARGQATDARSDIFSLGTVLYEMASGKRAFQRATGIETLSAILNDEPAELASSDRGLPPALTRIVERCLEKSPERRLQSAQDLAFALENVSGSGSVSQMGALPAAPAAPWRWVWWITPAAVVVAAAATWALTRAPGAAPPPIFMQLTFRQGTINNARFEPNGAGVMYSAEWDGAPPQIYERRTGDMQARALGISGALADVSSSGQLAVIEDCRPTEFDNCTGTLAVASGGAPRKVASNVMAAAFSPAGPMAVVRQQGGKFQLEYPLGHVLVREPVGWLASPRFSPDGRSIAFADYPLGSLDAGNVDVIAAAGGTPRVLASGYASLEGLAWADDGHAIEAAGTRKEDSANAIHEIPLRGTEHVLRRFPTPVQLLDLAGAGNMLLAQTDWQVQLLGHFPGDTGERDLTWQDWSLVRAISPDGKQVMFCECGVGGGPHLSSYIRATDGGPALRLGEGNPQTVSPDWKYAVINVPTTPMTYELLPTGVGSAVPLHYAGLSIFGTLFLPPGQGLLIGGSKAGVVRAYVQALRDGAPSGTLRPISGAIENAGVPAPGNAGVPLLNATDRKWYLYRTSGSGTPRLLSGLQANEEPIGWTTDGRRVYVVTTHGVTATIEAVDVASGQRTQVLHITPQNLAGVRTAPTVLLTPDARYYAYSVDRFKSSLFEAIPDRNH